MKPLLFSLFALVAFFPKNLLAHGDEIPTDPGVATDHFTTYGQSDRYELTLYYPELTAGKEAHLTLFVADYFSNRPLKRLN